MTPTNPESTNGTRVPLKYIYLDGTAMNYDTDVVNAYPWPVNGLEHKYILVTEHEKEVAIWEELHDQLAGRSSLSAEIDKLRGDAGKVITCLKDAREMHRQPYDTPGHFEAIYHLLNDCLNEVEPITPPTQNDADFIAKEDAEFKAVLDHDVPPTPKDEPGEVCRECDGSGGYDDEDSGGNRFKDPCDVCQGTGKRRRT